MHWQRRPPPPGFRLPPDAHKGRRFPRTPGLFAALALLLVAGCAPFPESASYQPAHHGGASQSCNNVGAGSSYIVFGRRYHVLRSADGYNKRGIASWYGPNFRGKLTSSGQTYDMYAATAASKVLPLCTWVKVTNLENGRSTVVQINDRGPFVENRIIDLSYAAARNIGMVTDGTALVNVRTIAAPSRRPPKNLAKESRRAPTPILHHRARLYLQVGAFLKRRNASRLRAKLLLHHVGRIRIKTGFVHGRRFYQVQVGPYGTVAQIDRLGDRLARLGYRDTEVVIQ